MNSTGTADGFPRNFNEVLLEELRKLRPDTAALQSLNAPPSQDPSNPDLDEVARGENLRRLYKAIADMEGEQRLSALCLSGGGVRSATFNLGVLQGLARRGLIDRFDYLSTVSGGGYIGGWLKAWMQRAGTARVCNELGSRVPQLPLKPEPRPVDRLREFSNYLTPRKGLLSGDTWAAFAIVVRNLLLNWMVVVPVLMCLAGLPQLYLLAIHLKEGSAFAPVAFGAAIVLGLIAAVAIHRFRHPPRAEGTESTKILGWAVLPLLLSTVFLSLGAAWLESSLIDASHLAVFATLWCILLPLFGWSLREPFSKLKRSGRWPVRELFALVVSGAVSAGLLVWATVQWLPFLAQRPILYTVLVVPMLLGLYLLARTLFVAFAEGFPRRDPVDVQATTGPLEDTDREWWARLSGHVLMAAVIWLVVSTIVLFGWHFAVRYSREYTMSVVSGTGIVSGIIAMLLGKGAETGSGHEASGKPEGPAWKNWVLGAAAPLFCIAVLVLLAHLNMLLIRLITGNPRLGEVPASWLGHEAAQVTGRDVGLFLLVLVGLLAFGFLMGLTVNVNRFSLHGLYRNRLVRAYLGASNPRRRPDPFTGFALSDNLGMHELWKEARTAGDIDCTRPLLVVNTTLNLVRGTKLAWQERKAESFSISPFYCGNFYEGYRSSRSYGGHGHGLSLGTALTISGAAANPNMGYHSSPAITFLLGILNARLGAWLGNTNIHGQKTYPHPGPRSALRPLFAELLGLTGSQSKYVQLSDGGHFDNLGLYEMVLRRCRFIVVSDAGRDPSSGFEDLGNAIRKIRIDFGISVAFAHRIEIVPRTDEAGGLYCAIGEICYDAADGCGSDRNGVLLYLKPTLKGRGDEIPYDVFSYSRAAKQFPHESTLDQWFDESQFESYRALGLHLIEQITSSARGQTMRGFADFQQAVKSYMETAPDAKAASSSPGSSGRPPADSRSAGGRSP